MDQKSRLTIDKTFLLISAPYTSMRRILMEFQQTTMKAQAKVPTAGIGGVGEIQSIPNKLKEMKSLDLKAGIENSNRYLNMKLPPLLHEGPAKKDLLLPRVSSRKSFLRGNTLEDLKSGLKK